MPVTRQEIESRDGPTYKEILAKQGVDGEFLAKKHKRELNAKITKHIKIKGAVRQEDLPKTNHKIIAVSGVVYEDKGGEDVYSTGETVIAVQLDNMSLRQRAREDALKARGDYAPTKHEHSGSVVVERTDEERAELKAIAKGVAKALQMQGKE